MHAAPRPTQPRYDPWRDLAERWPEIDVVIEPMEGSLLGELRYPVIALRAGTSAAQRRCTLTHELVHLERGTRDCGPWAAREELHVHREVARRLIGPDELACGVRGLGGTDDLAALAHALDVDEQTLRLRLELVTPAERARIRTVAASDLWRVA
jgi:Zn-dependent peptidase ImmA (M78 family)